MPIVRILHRALRRSGDAVSSIRWDAPDARQDPRLRATGAWTSSPAVMPPAPGALDFEQAKELLRNLLPEETAFSVAFWVERGTNAYCRLTAPLRRDGFTIDPASASIQVLDDGRYAVFHLHANWSGLMDELKVEFPGFADDLEWPARMWADDGSWIVRSPWDSHYTVVEGSPALIAALHADSVLETPSETP